MPRRPGWDGVHPRRGSCNREKGKQSKGREVCAWNRRRRCREEKITERAKGGTSVSFQHTRSPEVHFGADLLMVVASQTVNLPFPHWPSPLDLPEPQQASLFMGMPAHNPGRAIAGFLIHGNACTQPRQRVILWPSPSAIPCSDPCARERGGQGASISHLPPATLPCSVKCVQSRGSVAGAHWRRWQCL